MPKEVIARGAEAILYRDTFEGQPVLVKERIKKPYRILQIDERLRTGRTRTEARLMNEARRAGVAVPNILKTDERAAKIIMGFIDGPRLKELLNQTDEKNKKGLAKKIGASVARLHGHGIIHGDLTTSNMILFDDRVFFIDFGLGFFSSRPEDMGTDLAVLHEALRSTHFEHLNILWGIFVKSYSAALAAAPKALKALEDIEKRGRYVRRTAKKEV